MSAGVTGEEEEEEEEEECGETLRWSGLQQYRMTVTRLSPPTTMPTQKSRTCAFTFSSVCNVTFCGVTALARMSSSLGNLRRRRRRRFGGCCVVSADVGAGLVVGERGEDDDEVEDDDDDDDGDGDDDDDDACGDGGGDDEEDAEEDDDDDDDDGAEDDGGDEDDDTVACVSFPSAALIALWAAHTLLLTSSLTVRNRSRGRVSTSASLAAADVFVPAVDNNAFGIIVLDAVVVSMVVAVEESLDWGGSVLDDCGRSGPTARSQSLDDVPLQPRNGSKTFTKLCSNAASSI